MIDDSINARCDFFLFVFYFSSDDVLSPDSISSTPSTTNAIGCSVESNVRIT